MNKIRRILRRSTLLRGFYIYLRRKKAEWKKNRKTRYKGQFIDRSKKSKLLCVILAGYKEYLYDATFTRIKNCLLPGMDVCVVTSGLYSDRIAELCETNGWSYLSTRQNNVALVQNAAINLHPKAEYIFKLDEDIFLTENYFANMLRAYKDAQKGGYCPGVLAPLLPVNGYGHYRILDKLGLLDYYRERFEEPKYKTGMERLVEKSPETAKFFWGEGGIVPSIDEMNERFQEEPLEERPCAIRFSIGAVLFERDFWDEMGYFNISSGGGNGLGMDEVQICEYCMLKSRPLMVSENVVVGHFSFGNQNESMKKYYLENQDRFKGVANERIHGENKA